MTTTISQDVPKFALSKIFASEARVAVLRMFMIDPYRAYYQRQIEATTGLPIRAIQRELERLTSINLLYRRVDGNRCYYQVDTQFVLYPELRAMFLKIANPIDYIRGQLAVDTSVQLLLLCGEEKRTLVVTTTGNKPDLKLPDQYQMSTMGSVDFSKALSEEPETLEPFLVNGVDLLGRRDDIIWRHIESAGYSVKREVGVA